MAETTLPRFGLFNTEARIFHSNCIDQDFQIGVWFPFSYFNSERTYPVLYVPDGEYAFPVAAGLIPTLMGSGEVPEMVVVGVSYHGISGWGEFGVLRDRDFCTQQFQAQSQETRHAAFTRFFQDELFPLIETHYRTDPLNRALFGFSSAGFFSLHMLLTQPGMFRRHIAASCTWPGADAYMLECARRYAELPDPPAADLFLTVGACEAEQLPGFHELVKTLEEGRYPNLRLKSHVFEGEGHSAGMIGKTFLAGLKAVFEE
jgi:predicted alpha/beta superfamily hydrolase